MNDFKHEIHSYAELHTPSPRLCRRGLSLSKKYTPTVKLHKDQVFGEPLDRVPHATTIHWIVVAPLLIL